MHKIRRNKTEEIDRCDHYVKHRQAILISPKIFLIVCLRCGAIIEEKQFEK